MQTCKSVSADSIYEITFTLMSFQFDALLVSLLVNQVFVMSESISGCWRLGRSSTRVALLLTLPLPVLLGRDWFNVCAFSTESWFPFWSFDNIWVGLQLESLLQPSLHIHITCSGSVHMQFKSSAWSACSPFLNWQSEKPATSCLT